MSTTNSSKLEGCACLSSGQPVNEPKKKTFVIPSEANLQWSSGNNTTDVVSTGGTTSAGGNDSDSTDVVALAKREEKGMGNGVVDGSAEGLDQRIAKMSSRLQRLSDHGSGDNSHHDDDDDADADGQAAYPRQALDMIDGMSLFGVFDGHGGKEVSLFVKKVYAEELLCLESLQRGEYEVALRESFHHIDDMLEDPIYDTVLKQFRKLPNPSDRPPSSSSAAVLPPNSSSSASSSSSSTTQNTSSSDSNGSTNGIHSRSGFGGFGRKKSPHVSPYSTLRNHTGTEGTAAPGTVPGTGTGVGTGTGIGTSLPSHRMRRELKPPGQYTQPGIIHTIRTPPFPSHDHGTKTQSCIDVTLI